jgi:hypothetical protein
MHPLSLNHPKARGDARPAGPGLRSAEVGPSVITLRLTLPLVDAPANGNCQAPNLRDYLPDPKPDSAEYAWMVQVGSPEKDAAPPTEDAFG